MKYIRTTSDRIYAMEDLVKVEDDRFPNGYMVHGEVPITAIRYSDCIEELCDNIVVYDTCGNSPAILTRFLGSFDLKDWIEDSKRQNNRYIFYGAIWTDRGLIYVAKLKQDREFELL